MKYFNEKQKNTLLILITILIFCILADYGSPGEKRTGIKNELSAIAGEDASRSIKNNSNIKNITFQTDEQAQIYKFTDPYLWINEVFWFDGQQKNVWQEYPPYLFFIILIALLIILILTIFTRILQNRVNQRTQELKKTLSDMQKSERKYREIFNATTEAIFIHAVPGGQLLNVNKSMLEMYGYESEEDALSRNMNDFGIGLSPYSGADVREKIRLTMEEGPQIFEWLAKKQNGESFWTEVSLQSLQIDGEDQLLAVVRDITNRRQAEEALRTSESLLREAQTIANMGSYILNFSSGMWERSAILDKLFGINDAYIRSVEGWLDLIHPDHRQQMIDYFTNEIIGKHARFDREYKIIRKNDGAERWLHGLGELEFDAQNQLLKMHGVIQDITERKQAEQSLREHERQYRTLVEQIPAIVYIDNVSNGVINTLYVSPQVETILGFTPQEWQQNSPSLWDSLIFPDEFQVVNKKYMLCAQNGEPFSAEYRMRAASGQLLWVRDQAIMLRDETGNPQLIHGVIHDITERKQAEYEMSQRVMELETLYESGLAINQLLNPDEIGQKVIELLEQKLGWHHTTVRLYHPQDESLELLAFNQPGLSSEVRRHQVEERFKTLIAHSSQGMSGWAVQHKQLIRSNDLRNDARYVDTFPGLQSGLYVPMKLGERVIGVISIESEQVNAFSATDEQLAATLANQAASALENARLFEAVRKQHQVSDVLRDALSAGASMSASLDFETILDRLLEALERVIPFEGGSIMFVQPEKQKINIARIRGYKKQGAHVFNNILKLGFDMNTVENLRWMFNNKQPLVISDVDEYPGWIRTEESSFIRSWAGAPIIINDEVIAFFSLDSAEPNFFTDEHVELMRAFTGQASLALHNARLFEETERRFKEFAALYETSNILSSEIELTPMLQAIVEHTKKLLGTASSGIYLYLSETDELVLTVDVTPYSIIGTRLKSGEGAAGHVAKTRQPLRLDDYSTWEKRSLKYEGIAFHAVLGVPMLYGGELIGVLVADETGESKRTFTEADERLLSLFASQAAGAIHSARLREQTARRLDQLQALHIIDRAISSSFDLRPILNTVITQTIAQLKVDAVDILLFHPHLQMLDYVAGQGFCTRAVEQTHLRLGEGVAGRAAFERRTIHIPNLAETDFNFTRSAILENEFFLDYYAVPITAKGEIKGVLEVFNRTALPLNPEWLDFLETLAGQAAITIDQTQLFDDLERVNLELIIAYDATIEGWARAMDLRDKETESHTRRVTEMTITLAKALGVKDSEILHIRRGALLHDIGKMGVPDNILPKEGEFTEAEWILMRRHPQFAYEMLQPIKYLRQSLDIPYCHHEKWDGTGYPRELKGERIPLAARIFAIIDVWDAVTIDRPYRKGWTKKKALKYIREQSGKHFEPRIVDAFLELFGNEKK